MQSGATRQQQPNPAPQVPVNPDRSDKEQLAATAIRKADGNVRKVVQVLSTANGPLTTEQIATGIDLTTAQAGPVMRFVKKLFDKGGVKFENVVKKDRTRRDGRIGFEYTPTPLLKAAWARSQEGQQQ